MSSSQPARAETIATPTKHERTISVILRFKGELNSLTLGRLTEDQLHFLLVQLEHALDALHDGKEFYNGERG